MARRGQSSLRHDHAHSQVSAPVLPAPQFTLSLLESAHCRQERGPLFNTHHSRSRGRLLATYLLTYRAPGRREKATYLLFGTTGIELRSSKKNQTQVAAERVAALVRRAADEQRLQLGPERLEAALVPQRPSRACLSTSSAWSALASSSAAATAYFLTALAPAAMVQPGSATAPLKQQRGKSTWTGPGRL